MALIGNPNTKKYGFTVRTVPSTDMVGYVPMSRAPRVGDLVLAEVLTLGRHTKMEVRSGVTMHLFPGDLIVGAFGNRYATDQFEGYVPEGPVKECDLLSVGGVCGEVVSRHESMQEPTRLRVLGFVSDRENRPINQRDFGLAPIECGGRAEVIAVVGSSMNSGKTHTAGTLARALSRKGFLVAAAKVTGTACSKDLRFFESCGAHPTLDFTSVGYPSTYMIGLEELLSVYRTLLAHLRAADPDYIVIEVADGIFQRETGMLLGSEVFRSSINHLFFSSGDSLSAESGARLLKQHGLPLRATAGALTQSELAIREAEVATGLPCLSVERMMDGELPALLAAKAEAGRVESYLGVGA